MKLLLRVVLQMEKKEGSGKVASFFVAISLGKGICYCQHYEKLSVNLLVEFVENSFIEIFKKSCNPIANLFVKDGDPSQSSKATKTALDKIGAVQFSIPIRSPDFSPIKNFQFS